MTTQNMLINQKSQSTLGLAFFNVVELGTVRL